MSSLAETSNKETLTSIVRDIIRHKNPGYDIYLFKLNILGVGSLEVSYKLVNTHFTTYKTEILGWEDLNDRIVE